MNMRKIIAVLAAVLLLCTAIPMGVYAAPGDVVIDNNFDDGSCGFERSYNENGYIVFDATTADWQNTFAYMNLKSDTMYKVTFSAKANKEANLTFKVSDNWKADGYVVSETVAVTTDWQDFELIASIPSIDSAVVIFSSGYEAGNAPIYCIDNLKIVEIVDPALIGKVVNGDFSTTDGWTLGTGATIADGVLNLTDPNLWGEAALQSVPAKANTNYEITWKSQRISGTGAFNLFVMDSSNANLTKVAGQNWMNETSGNWVNNSYTINTGASEIIKIKFSTEVGPGVGTILIDDFTITEIKDPSFDGVLYNGDFETGKITPWENLWGSNTVEMVAGQNSDNAIKVTGGTWTQVYQSVNVEPDTDYIAIAWSKDASNSALWIKSAGGNSDVANSSFPSGSDWAMTTVSFNSGSNTSMWVGLMSLAAGGTCTVDNVKVVKAIPASDDGYIKNGNFESGALSPWGRIWDSQIDAAIIDDGHEGNFAVKAIGKSAWGQIRQSVTVEPNTEYKITLWAKNVNSMNLLVKDGNDSYNISNAGIDAGEEWTEITGTFNSGDNTSVYVGVMVNEAASYGTFDDFKMEKVEATCEHNYELTGGDWATCDTDGYAVYTCSACGASYEETITAYHNGNLTYVPAVEAIDCQNPGNIEHYFCEGCYEYFADAYATEYLNPWYINITVDCVRPEGAADCATVPCEVCGEDVYGYGEHDVVVCQGGVCGKCGDTIEGYGCANYDTPACEDGVCYYCGGFVAGYGHENGAWAPCLDGECAYGCGLKYPAEQDHADADGDDYCDNCWSHLACIDADGDNYCDVCWSIMPHDCVDADGDGWCDICWSEMPEEPVETIYGDANGDGEVDGLDEVVLAQYNAGWDVELDLAAADANGDGEVDGLDEVLLAQYNAGWDVVLGG